MPITVGVGQPARRSCSAMYCLSNSLTVCQFKKTALVLFVPFCGKPPAASLILSFHPLTTSHHPLTTTSSHGIFSRSREDQIRRPRLHQSARLSPVQPGRKGGRQDDERAS